MPCRACGKPHPSSMRCEVWSAINKPAINSDAINKDVEVSPVPASGKEVQAAPGVVSRTANRRSREAYNAYMREYMKAKRGRQA